MDDPALEHVLRLVADGRLTAEEAGPILDAIDSKRDGSPDRQASDEPPPSSTAGTDAPGRALRIEVTDAGRAMVNLRVPLSLGLAAVSQVPGISEATAARVREAIEGGIKGP